MLRGEEAPDHDIDELISPIDVVDEQLLLELLNIIKDILWMEIAWNTQVVLSHHSLCIIEDPRETDWVHEGVILLTLEDVYDHEVPILQDLVKVLLEWLIPLSLEALDDIIIYDHMKIVILGQEILR